MPPQMTTENGRSRAGGPEGDRDANGQPYASLADSHVRERRGVGLTDEPAASATLSLILLAD